MASDPFDYSAGNTGSAALVATDPQTLAAGHGIAP